MEPTDVTPPSPHEAPPPDDDVRQRAKFNSKRSLAWITAIGTLLAGVAGVASLWARDGGPTPGDGGGTVSATDAPTASAAPVTSFAGLADLVESEASAALPAANDAYEGYEQISTDRSAVKAPRAWDDRESAMWRALDGNVLGVSTAASRDIPALFYEVDEPGIWLGTSEEYLDPHEVISINKDTRLAACRGGGAERPFIGEGYVGEFRIWTKCGDVTDDGSVTVDFAAQDARTGAATLLFFRLADLRDVAAFRTAMDSFTRLGTVSSSSGNPQPVDENSPPRGPQPTPVPDPSVGPPPIDPGPQPSPGHSGGRQIVEIPSVPTNPATEAD